MGEEQQVFIGLKRDILFLLPLAARKPPFQLISADDVIFPNGFM
jgi:hypothetical protein